MKISVPLLATSASVLLVSTFAAQAGNQGYPGLPSVPGVYEPPLQPVAPDAARGQGSSHPYALSPSPSGSGAAPTAGAPGSQFGNGSNQLDSDDDEDDFSPPDEEEE